MTRHYPASIFTFTSALLFSACESYDQPLAVSNSTIICRGCSDLYVVAHQDDDLLFMNPDILNSIQGGNTTRTTFVTAGDASGPASYWQSRESGILAAYAQMAGVPNSWWSGTQTIAGRQLQVRELNGTNVSVIFLRLPDPTNGDPSLAELWANTTPTLSSRDGANTYTREQLIHTLHQIMIDSAAERVSTLDSTNTHLSDHRDHIHSALFALVAHERYSAPHTLSIYRTYSTEFYRPNMHSNELSAKWNTFNTYAPFDFGNQGTCPGGSNIYCTWSQRQYNFSSDADGAGVIGLSDGRCLSIDSATPYNGALLRLGPCNSGNALHFSINNFTITASGYCATASGANAVLAPCNGGTAQRFTMTNSAQIRAPGAGCLESPGGNALAVGACPSVQSLFWSLQPRDATYFSVTNQFGDADGTSPWYAQTFRLGDLNNDGRADACMRKLDGIYCALAGTSGFGAYSRWTTEFSDALGWATDIHGTTIQLGDINGDGRADVCGRGGAGIICANSNGTSFTNPSLRSTGFSNGSGWSGNSAYYRSIRLGDVDGDGIDDVCGRGSGGMWCARGQSNGIFAAMLQWSNGPFGDAQGWLTSFTGTTVQLGDINADGRADVCGRGTGGIYCAVSNGLSFINAHDWSYQGDYSDSGSWSPETHSQSIRLADIDGDGGADVCGRGDGGIWCSTSNGNNNFAPARLVMPRDYTDGHGWDPVYYGATLALGDLDADGRADICGRGGARLICAVR